MLVDQSCLTLCDLMDCSPPGSSVPGILQAIILEWIIIPFSRESFWPRSWTQVSHIASIFFTVWAREPRWHKYTPFSPWEVKLFPRVFSSVQSLNRVRIYNPMDCSTPGFPVLHQLLELAQTHLHWVGNATQPSHPLSPTSPAFSLSQHFPMSQLFTSGGQSIWASASVLSVNIQGWFPLGLTG